MRSNKLTARYVCKNIYRRPFTVRIQTQSRKAEAKYFPRQTEQTVLLRYLVDSFFLGD